MVSDSTNVAIGFVESLQGDQPDYCFMMFITKGGVPYASLEESERRKSCRGLRERYREVASWRANVACKRDTTKGLPIWHAWPRQQMYFVFTGWPNFRHTTCCHNNFFFLHTLSSGKYCTKPIFSFQHQDSAKCIPLDFTRSKVSSA